MNGEFVNEILHKMILGQIAIIAYMMVKWMSLMKISSCDVKTKFRFLNSKYVCITYEYLYTYMFTYYEDKQINIQGTSTLIICFMYLLNRKVLTNFWKIAISPNTNIVYLLNKLR